MTSNKLTYQIGFVGEEIRCEKCVREICKRRQQIFLILDLQNNLPIFILKHTVIIANITE